MRGVATFDGIKRADRRDEAHKQNPRRWAQRHEGECLLLRRCGERKAESAFGRTEAGGDPFGRDRACGRL